MFISESIFKEIYKYYPMNSYDSESSILKKNNLRLNKIKNKKDSKQKEILRDIQNIVSGYEVIDWTDDESCCYEYKILLHKDKTILDDDKTLIKSLNGKRYDLRIFISILEPCYYEFIEVTQYLDAEDKWMFRRIKDYDVNLMGIVEKIDNYLFEKGYIRLSDNIAKTVVPGIETELKMLNCASVFDCLFTDLVTIY